MCEYCEKEKTMLSKMVINPAMLQWGCPIKTPSELYDHEYPLACFIDRGYMRLVDAEDCNCLDHGKKIKINFCPMCGKEFKD